MPFVARFGIALCVLGAVASAQVARFTHTGRVLDEQRKTVAGAKVTLVSAGGYGGLDEGDVVRVDADADGTFRAQLQPTRSYVAWATTARDDGFAVGAPVDVGSMPIDVIAGTEKVATSFRVTALAPWLEIGTLRVEISVFDCPRLAIRGELGADGKIQMPPLPNVVCEVRVFAKDVLVHATTCLTHDTVTLPSPRRLRVRVADDKGQPIAKAIVQRVVGHTFPESAPFTPRPVACAYPVATTGDDGTAEVLLASDKDPFEGTDDWMLFRAVHDGHAPGFSGFTNQAYASNEIVDAKKENSVLPFVLRTAVTMPIKVLAPGLRMPAAVQAVGCRRVPYNRNSTTSVGDCEITPIRDGLLQCEKGPSGRARIPFDGEMSAIELPYLVPPLPHGDTWLRSSRPMPLVLPITAFDKDEIDLRSVLPLRLLVIDTSAGPAIGAHVLCSPEAGDSFVDSSFAMLARSDRSGRVVFPVMPGRWFVMAVLDDGIAHAVVEAAPGLGPQTLQLHALDRMRVRVIDGAGIAVDGARFRPSSWGWAGSGLAEPKMLRRVSEQLLPWSLQRCVSKNGDADILFLAVKGLGINVHVQKGSLTSADVRLVVNDERVDIVLK